MTRNKTTQNSNGNKIKDTIKAPESTTQTIKREKSLEELREECISTHNEYKMLVNRNWSESIVEVVFEFLGGDFAYEDDMNEFAYFSIDLLEVMAKPEVNQCLKRHMSDYAINHISQMVRRIIYMCESLQHVSNKATLEQHFLENHTDVNTFQPETWQRKELEYRRSFYAELVSRGLATIEQAK